jgi:Fe-Mn family superoxide dismutase
MSSRLTAGDLQIITRVAVFRELKPETVQQIVAPATALMLRPHDWIQAGVTQFGSGWCWLAVKDGKIDYRNRRPDYLKAFLDHLVNWDYVAESYEAAMK